MAKAKALSRKAAQTKGALLVFLRPMIAQDQKIDLNPLLAGINNANFKAKKVELGTSLTTALKGKLANDADLGQLTSLLDALEEVEEEEGIDAAAPAATDPNSAIPLRESHDDQGPAQAREFLAGKLSSEDMASYDAMMGPEKKPEGQDEDLTEEERKAKEAKDKAAKDAEVDNKDKEEKVSKSAMDAAIKIATDKAAKDAETSVIARMRAARDAEKEVQPYIGTLAIAQDSADAIYKIALDHLGVDLTGIPASAYRAVLRTQPIPGSKKVVVAQDAAAPANFNARYPDAGRIGSLG